MRKSPFSARARARAWCGTALVAAVTAVAMAAGSASAPAQAAGEVRAQAATSTATSAATATAATAVAGEARVIVKYKADSSLMRALSAGTATTGANAATAAPQHAQALGARLGIALTDGLPVSPSAQLVKASGLTSADLAARLSAQSDVEYAVVDQRVHITAVPNDTYYGTQTTVTPASGQWYLRTPGVDGEVASINAPAAWNLTTGSASTVVAVVDTGITSHPDLTGKVLAGYDFISDATTAGDGDGRDADPTDPGDGVMSGQQTSITGCTSASVGPSSWHGTQTAGLIGAATNNGAGIASVGWNVMLLPLRVLGKCGGTETDVIAAIRWAVGGTVPGVPANTHPAKVINLSLGGDSGSACDSAYQDAVTFAISQGAVVVAAAGNDGLALGAPANCTGVIAVAGVRQLGTKVGYSDLGSNVTLAAPAGNCVNNTGQTCLYPLITTSNSGTYTVGNPIYTDGDVHQSLGTSFSAPLVSGTVALMFSVKPTLTPAQVRTALTGTARAFPQSGSPPIQMVAGGPFVPVAACQAPSSTAQTVECYCTTSTCGAGLLDAGAAVAAASQVAATPPTVAVTASAATVAAGTSVTFTSTASAPSTSLTYAWTITSGTAIATFSSATNAATATLATTGAGSVTVSLTVTDAAGLTGTSSSTVTVTGTAGTTSPVTGSSSGSSSSSSGGGSVSFGWLLGLLVAVLALWRVGPIGRRLPRRR